MVYIVTFDSVELKNPIIFDRDSNPIVNQTVLLSGKRSTQTTTETAISVSYRCSTETYSDVSNLKAKIGLQKTLTIDSTDFTKCSISSFKEREWYPGKWEYEVGFIQDTT